MESQHLAGLPSTASRLKSMSKLAWSRLRSVSLSSLDLGLQLHLWTRSITASKCIFKLAGSRWSRPQRQSPNSLDHGPQSASPNSLGHGLPVHLWVHSMLACDASPTSLNHGLRVHLWVHSIPASKWISKLAQLRSPSASLSSLNLGLQLHLQTRLIAANKSICKLARSRSWSVSLSSLDHHLPAHLELFSITACCQSRYTVCR